MDRPPTKMRPHPRLRQPPNFYTPEEIPEDDFNESDYTSDDDSSDCESICTSESCSDSDTSLDGFIVRTRTARTLINI